MGCIYKIANIKNGKFYIGSTNDFERRKREHIELLYKNKHHSKLLQNDWNEFGADSFHFEIVENVPDKQRKIYEQRYLDQLVNTDLKYNIVKDAFAGLEYYNEKEKRCRICGGEFTTKFRKHKCCSHDCLDTYFSILEEAQQENQWKYSNYDGKNVSDWDIDDHLAAWWDDALEK
jgi:group I intron endonuclease